MAFLLCFTHPSHREILQFHFNRASLCVYAVVDNILDQYYDNANNVMHVVCLLWCHWIPLPQPYHHRYCQHCWCFTPAMKNELIILYKYNDVDDDDGSQYFGLLKQIVRRALCVYYVPKYACIQAYVHENPKKKIISYYVSIC